MNYSRIMDKLFGQFTGPKFSVKLWDGQEHFYGTGSSVTFAVTIHDKITARLLLTQGAFAFGEAYMDERITVRGDLDACLRLHHQLQTLPSPLRLIRRKIAPLATFIAKLGRPRNRKDKIAYHYDLGNDFFQMLLDAKTMSYSAGRYEAGSENLASAQQKKLDLICQWLNLPTDASVLDLGFGWGGFAVHAATKMGWNITGYTLSNAQLEYCRQRIKKNRLENKVIFEYRDMVKGLPANRFDAIVMIESIEHVGKRRLFPFFKELKQALKPGGSVYIQATSRYAPAPPDPWVEKYVFPGTYLPAKEEYFAAADQAGLIVEKFRDDTPDYIPTLTEWIKNLESHKAEIEKKFDSAFYRLWELWLRGARVGFEARSGGLFRLHLRRPDYIKKQEL